MADATTFEEAKICPKCQLPGEDASTVSVPAGGSIRPGTTAHMIYCRNENCKWYNTNWVVQVNPDGSIPPPQDHSRTEKKYGSQIPDELGKRIVDNLGRQYQAETQQNTEINRPR